MLTLRRMRATFGRLENETLNLTPGLNIFTAPNEAGKSTWAAFLTAMFYGIDTAERVKKGAIPAKTKYKPWSGKPMEGEIELTWNGQDITLQRRSDGRTPMGHFAAYDTNTGGSLPFLTAETCGRTLLGVEKSVFLRSAFIGQSAMAVTQDAALEQKLLSLVTTGDESVSFAETERRLRDQKNRIRHNRTGLLPETEARLLAVDDKLRTIRRCHGEDTALLARRKELTEQTENLQYIEENLKASEAMQKQQQLSSAEARLRDAEQAHAAATQAADPLPPPDALSRMEDDLTGLPTEGKKIFPLWIAAAVLGAAGMGAFFLLRPAAYALLAVAAAVLTLWLVLHLTQRKALRRTQTQQSAILTAVRAFADNIYTADDALCAIRAAMDAHENAKATEADLRSARAAYDALHAAIGSVEPAKAPTEDFTDRYSMPQVTELLRQAELELRTVETTLAQHRGAVEALGDPAALEADKEALMRRRGALEQQNAALTLALETLSEAAVDLRSRFSPQISHMAADILRRMTDSRYDGVRMEQDMTLHARPFGEAVTRELLQLSGGTADQLYLALRLAVCRLALDESTPLILDDALVFFDDVRLARTMELLKEEAQTRQILLFSCQSREAKLFSQL